MQRTRALSSAGDTDNPFLDHYIWRAEEPPDTSDMVVFRDEEKTICAQDEITGHWHLHRLPFRARTAGPVWSWARCRRWPRFAAVTPGVARHGASGPTRVQ